MKRTDKTNFAKDFNGATKRNRPLPLLEEPVLNRSCDNDLMERVSTGNPHQSNRKTWMGDSALAKRFTDTTKWGRHNFRLLSPKLKLVWLYILDSCDHAGVWHVDFDLMSFQIGETVTEEEFLQAFSSKVERYESGLYIIPSFIEFQYKLPLKPSNKVHISAMSRLEEVRTSKGLARGYPSPLAGATLGAKDKEEDKDKDKVKEQEKEKEQEEDPKMNPIEALIDTIPVKAQAAWEAVWGSKLVQTELPKAASWWITNPEKRKPLDTFPRFANSWFQNEKERPRQPTHAPYQQSNQPAPIQRAEPGIVLKAQEENFASVKLAPKDFVKMCVDQIAGRT